MGIIGPILNLVLFVGLLAMLGIGIIWLVRQLNRRTMSTVPAAGADPLEITRQRLASGEISVTEFDEIRGRLQG